MTDNEEEAQKEAQRTEIRHLQDAVGGLELSVIARSSGLAASTLTRFMRGESKSMLSARTMNKVRRWAGTKTPLDGIPRKTATEAVLAVADVLGVSREELTTAAADDRTREWLNTISTVPVSADDLALNMLRGLRKSGSPAQKKSGPGPRLRSRIKS